jgi:hypothetical protein
MKTFPIKFGCEIVAKLKSGSKNPSSAPEYTSFCELMEENQRQAEGIESAWAEAGRPTFKTYVRVNLARRQAASWR